MHDPADILGELFDHIQAHVVLPSDAHAIAVTLWSAHTHFMPQLRSTPRLSLQSPDKQSGKTRLLEVIGPALHDPLNVVNMTPAVMFRAIAQWQPTFIIDEIDAFFPKGGKAVDQAKEDIRAMINAGHRTGASVMRANAKDHNQLDKFPVFTPVVMAGISTLPDTIEDRSIIVHMRRRRPEEEIAPYRDKDDEVGLAIGRRIAEWASVTTLPAEVDMPLQDRPADVWEPLFMVAEAAGGVWPALLRNSVDVVRAEGRKPDDDERVILLRDIRQIADDSGEAGIHATLLVSRLNMMAESPWQRYDYGRGISAYQIRQLLKDYGISSRQVKVSGTNGRGYRFADFEDAFARYLSGEVDHTQSNGHDWATMLQLAQAYGDD